MGNTSSKDGESSASSPVGAANVPSRTKSKRGEPGRFEPKSTTAAPATSLESATGQSANSARSSMSQPRGRSSTQNSTSQAIPIPVKDSSKRTTSGSAQAQARLNTSATPNRSTSPGQKQLPSLTPITTDVPGERLAPTTTPEGVTSPESYYLPQPQFSRPPRVPLPIEEEVHDPGSPIPVADDEQPEPPQGIEEGIFEQVTALMDDDVNSVGEPEDLFGATGIEGLAKIPTVLEWKGPGGKIFVTGSFAKWDKKYKLHRNGGSSDPDTRSGIFNLPPGTHHIMFLVDGSLVASTHMPTTVEYGNLLVNYIEIPVPTTERPAEKPFRPATPELKSTATGTTPAVSNIALPARTPSQKHRPAPPAPGQQEGTSNSPRPSATRKVQVTAKWTKEIPEYLALLDAPEGTARYARANAVMDTQPQPPSLPMFLSKSILNGATPMKDDASVLIMPNHTVLNHLATSSIKSEVLATSATTRYKKKYVTTIMYRPTGTGAVEQSREY